MRSVRCCAQTTVSGTNNPNALIMIRDPGFKEGVPAGHTKKFVDTNPLSTVALGHLKARLRARLGDRCVDYTCSVAGVDASAGVEKVVMEGLAGFEDACFDGMVASATAQYGGEARETPSEQLVADEAHTAHRDRMAHCIGRDAELERITAFAATASGVDKGKVLIVEGSSGVGKSTVLAAAAVALEQSGRYRVFYHAASVSGAVGAYGALHLRLVSTFAAEYLEIDDLSPGADHASTMAAAMTVQPDHDWRRQKHAAIAAVNEAMVAQPDLPIVIIYDDGHVFDHARDCPGTYWICSKLRHGTTDFELDEGKQESTLLLLPLAPEGRRAFAAQRLAKYKKALDPGQMTTLVSKPEAGWPRWLCLACDEIRMHGVYETIGSKIEALGETHEALLEQSCDRLIADDEAGGGLPGRALVFLSMSNRGLSEAEIRTLLFDSVVASEGGERRGGWITTSSGCLVEVETLSYADWAYTLLKIRHLVDTYGSDAADSSSSREVMYFLPMTWHLRDVLLGKFGTAVTESSGVAAAECRVAVDYFKSDRAPLARQAAELPTLLVTVRDKTTFRKMMDGSESSHWWANLEDTSRSALAKAFGCHGIVPHKHASHSVGAPAAVHGHSNPSGGHKVVDPNALMLCQTCHNGKDPANTEHHDRKATCFICAKWLSQHRTRDTKYQVRCCTSHARKLKNRCAGCHKFMGALAFARCHPVYRCVHCHVKVGTIKCCLIK